MYYKRGFGIEVDLGNQGNYICLREIDESVRQQISDYSKISDIVKQKSPDLFILRKGAVVTGSTLHKAIGHGTLEDQKTHHDKVFRGIEQPVSPALQKLFDHGNENEIHALGTNTKQ